MSYRDNLDALNQAMKYLQGGRISDTPSRWLCRVSYSEGKGSGAAIERSEYEVNFSFDSNDSRVSIPAFEGLRRHPDYPSRLKDLNIELDENDDVLTIKGRNQKTSKDYELNIFLQGAKRLD